MASRTDVSVPLAGRGNASATPCSSVPPAPRRKTAPGIVCLAP